MWKEHCSGPVLVLGLGILPLQGGEEAGPVFTLLVPQFLLSVAHFPKEGGCGQLSSLGGWDLQLSLILKTEEPHCH